MRGGFFCILGFISVLGLGTNCAKAQESVNLAAWADLTYTYGINTTWGFGGDAGLRGVARGDDRTSAYIRPIFIYRNTDRLNVGVSFGAFQNFNSTSPNLFEFRPAQQMNFTWPKFTKWSLRSRVRLEERYLQYGSSESADTPENSWEFRGRYELKFKTEPFGFGQMRDQFYVLASGEYFVPLSRKAPEVFADQTRFIVGYGHDAGSKITYEVHFFWQRSRDDASTDYNTDQYVLRLRLFMRNKPREFVEED